MLLLPESCDIAVPRAGAGVAAMVLFCGVVPVVPIGPPAGFCWPAAVAGFGGVKGSGWGLEFGIDGLKALTQPQIISLKKKPQ